MSTRIRHCIEISCSTNTKEEPHESVGSLKRAPPVMSRASKCSLSKCCGKAPLPPAIQLKTGRLMGIFRSKSTEISLTDSRADPSAHRRVTSA